MKPKSIPLGFYEYVEPIFNLAKDRDEYPESDDWWVTDELDYWDVPKKDWKKTVELAQEAYGNFADNNYDGLLQLHDHHTLWNVYVAEEYTDVFDDEYAEIVDYYWEMFKDITGEEFYMEGRSGRHVCVNATLDNCYNWEYLSQVAIDLEGQMIRYINDIYGEKE